MKKRWLLSILCSCILPQFMVYAQSWDQCFFNRGPLINKAPMPEGRAMMASSVIDGKIFTTCGYYDYGYTDTSVMKSTVNVYDPLTDTWDTGRTPIPYTRGMHGHGQSVVDGKWYVVGGIEWEPTTDGWMAMPLARVDVYDPQTDSWKLKASLPEPKGGNGICVLDGKIYVTGGYSGLLVSAYEIPGQFYKSVYMYDPTTDTWTAKADMNFARAFHTTIAWNGKIYAFGGNVEITTDSIRAECGGTAEVYDPEKDRWTPISKMPSTMRGFRDAAGCVVDNKIYLLGGNHVWTSARKGLSQIIRYNPEKDQWSLYGYMPEPSYSHSICAFGRKIYIVGGRRGEGQVCGSVEELELGDVVLDELIPDTSIIFGDSVTLDLSQHFSHLNGEPITYTACSTPEGYVSGSCKGHVLTLYGLKKVSDIWVSILAESGEDQLGDWFRVQVKEAEVTGIPGKDPNSYMFQIFPNPAGNRITIQTQREGTQGYVIYSPNGQKLLEGILTGSDPGIDISMLEKGLYLISVNSPERSVTNKFIKL